MILASNIVNSKNTQMVAEEILLQLKESLELSLGPYGSTTIIEDRQIGHIMTKDGFSILDQIRFNEPVSMTFLNIIKDISLKLVQTVGDGSTSSIISSYYFYHTLKNALDKKARPQEIINTLDRCVNYIEGRLQKYARPISNDLKEIKDLAAVSLNNDEETGDIIYEIYKEIGIEGFINIQLGSSYKTTYKKVQGFQFRAGYLDPILINNETEECELDDAAILVFNSAINNPDAFKVLEAALMQCLSGFKDCNGKYKSILIIAPDYNDTSKALFRQMVESYRAIGKNPPFNILSYSMNTEDRVAEVEDLVTATGARKVMLTAGEEMDIIANKDGLSVVDFFGYSGKVVSNFKSSTFMNNGDETNKTQLQIRKDSVRHQLKLAEEEGTLTLERAYTLNKRLAILEQKLVTIYVGGNSEHQRKTNKTLMEDAVAACKSALKHGYVIGGNLAIPIVISQILQTEKISEKEKMYLRLISDAFIEVYATVLRNGIGDEEKIAEVVEKSLQDEAIYNLIDDSYTTTKVINSVETEIEILKNVTSIISLILTSNQFIMSQVGMYSSKELEILK